MVSCRSPRMAARNWRRVEDFPGVPKWAYVSDVDASPIDANVIFVTLNNWQRGDYKPYIVQQQRSRPDLDEHHGQPAGTSTMCGRSRRTSSRRTCCLRAPSSACSSPSTAGATGCSSRAACRRRRCATSSSRSARVDVVMATFGRGFWVLDDYSALREVSAQAMAEEARLFPTRPHAYQFTPWGVAQDGAAGLATLGGNYTMPNPPIGAVITYNVAARTCRTTCGSSPTSWTQRQPVPSASSSTRPRDSIAPRGTCAVKGRGRWRPRRAWRWRGAQSRAARPRRAAVRVQPARRAQAAAGAAGAPLAAPPQALRRTRRRRRRRSRRAGPLSHRDRQTRGRHVHGRSASRSSCTVMPLPEQNYILYR